jgi:hypothetical protein
VHELVQDAGPRLRDDLAVKTAREAAVTVRPRREPVDFYA